MKDLPSLEQKQSGNLQLFKSHSFALLGSMKMSQSTSSLPSEQSCEPSQKYSCGKQVPSAHPSWPTVQLASSNRGWGIVISENDMILYDINVTSFLFNEVNVDLFKQFWKEMILFPSLKK